MQLRLLALTAFALGLAGCETPNYYNGTPFQTSHKVLVRRRSPTKEELAAIPPKPYEQELREEDALEQRLAVPRDIHDQTRYWERGDLALTRWARTPRDSWDSYELDRKRVLVHPWADVGPPFKPAPDAALPFLIDENAPKPEKPIEEDPYAPAKKVPKKGEGEEGSGDKPSDDKPADKPEKK